MDDPTWRLYSQLSSQPPDLRVISGVYDTNEIKLKKKGLGWMLLLKRVLKARQGFGKLKRNRVKIFTSTTNPKMFGSKHEAYVPTNM